MEDIGGLQAYLDSLPDEEKKVRHVGFVCLIEGRPCSLASLSEELSVGEEALRKTISTMEIRGTITWDHDLDRLTATGGLSLEKTPHSLTLPHQDLYAWCAADAVGIPAALGLDAEISSSCHQCGTPVSITLQAGNIGRSIPQNTTLWVVTGDPSQSVSGHT